MIWRLKHQYLRKLNFGLFKNKFNLERNRAACCLVGGHVCVCSYLGIVFRLVFVPDKSALVCVINYLVIFYTRYESLKMHTLCFL